MGWRGRAALRTGCPMSGSTMATLSVTAMTLTEPEYRTSALKGRANLRADASR
jgi:hypothetical protein